eukprot:1865293-Pyramimonas_sp.AAC.1
MENMGRVGRAIPLGEPGEVRDGELGLPEREGVAHPLLGGLVRAWCSPPGPGGNPPCAQSIVLVVEGVGENSHGIGPGGCLSAA